MADGLRLSQMNIENWINIDSEAVLEAFIAFETC